MTNACDRVILRVSSAAPPFPPEVPVSALPARLASGLFPHCTDVGCYPLHYLTGAGLLVCAKCASADTSDPVTACEVYWEGPPETCEDCGAAIESAYGDPRDPEEV